jgi:transcriptional regulator with XRE-family HTH domain
MVVEGAMSKEDPLMEFGREVRRRREAAKLTLEELAERAGLTPNYIGTIENGKRDPSLSTIVALARGLSVASGELFGSLPEISIAAEEAGGLFDKTAPEVQSALLAILRATGKKPRVK